MPPFINELAKGGTIGLVVASFIWLIVFLLNRESKKEKEATTALIQELTQSVIQSTRDNATFNALHNERSMEFQKQVSEAHRSMMEMVSAIMQMLVLQNGKMEYYTASISEIKQGIKEACEKVAHR